MPNGGNQPSFTEKKSTNIKATQKLGMEIPNMAMNIERRSPQPSG